MLAVGSLFLCLTGCNITGNNNPPTATPRSAETPEDPGSTASPSAIDISTPSDPGISPFIDVNVTGVEIHFLETFPVQVQLVIHGTVPDQCTYVFHALDKRIDHQIKVTLTGRHPAGGSCTQTSQDVEHTLLLGGWLPEGERGFEPGDYQLLVNLYQTSFSIAP